MQLCSDVNKTATSSSHQDSEYDTASDSQSSDEADPLQKREPIGVEGGGGSRNNELGELVKQRLALGSSDRFAGSQNVDDRMVNDEDDGDVDDDEDSRGTFEKAEHRDIRYTKTKFCLIRCNL